MNKRLNDFESRRQTLLITLEFIKQAGAIPACFLSTIIPEFMNHNLILLNFLNSQHGVMPKEETCFSYLSHIAGHNLTPSSYPQKPLLMHWKIEIPHITSPDIQRTFRLNKGKSSKETIFPV